MQEDLGDQLIHATDEAFESCNRNATMTEWTCRFCCVSFCTPRAPYYAVLYTPAGTIHYPICGACVEADTAKALERLEALEKHMVAKAQL